MQEFDFLRPKTLKELFGILADTRGRILAGGTDNIPKMRRAQFSAGNLVDISEIDELRFIRIQDQQIQIGSLTTHQELASSPILSARALLNKYPNPSDDEIRESLSGNLCRCTGNSKMVDAIRLAAKEYSHGRYNPYNRKI